MNNFLITILSLSASGSILALILFLLKPLLKNKVSKAFSYYIWLLVLLRLIVPYSAPVNMMETQFKFEQSTVMDAPPKQAISPPIENPGKVIKIPFITQQVPVFSSQQPNNTTDSTDLPMKPQRSLRSIIKYNLIWLWLAGTVICFGWFFIPYAIFSKRIRQSFTIPYNDDLDRFNRLIKGGSVRLFYSDYTMTPMLMGILHPVIVLPHFAYVHNGKEKELKVILSHELIHYRRKDILYKWLVVMVTSLHWFNPLMILVRKEIGRACELSCDEAVIKNMSEDEKHFYGNTLISLAARKKPNGCILATTLSEDKKKLKERLLNIMKFKRKSVGGGALMLILTLLLVGCASTLGALSVQETTRQTKEHAKINNHDDGEIGSDPVNQTTVQQVTEQTTNKHDVQKGSGSANDLLALKTLDIYENGKIFTDIPEDFVNTFKDKVAALSIPDARKGERAVDIQQADAIQEHAILFLDSIPEQNIYLYGYYNTDYPPGYGLILDIGQEQNVYLFPYRYMTNTMLSPELSTSSDGSKIYVNCHTGSGTGVSVSELYIFQVDNNRIEPFYVDINDLVNRLGEQLSISYDSDYEKVTVCSDSKTILTDRLTSFIGANNKDNLSPSSFYCGDFIYFIQEGDSFKVNWNPVLYAKEQPGAQCYLYNLDSLEAELLFIYDSHGNIIGFDIGEVTANTALTLKANMDGDTSTDLISIKYDSTKATFTVYFANGTFVTTSIDYNSDVSWASPYLLTTGDFDRDGKSEIVFAPSIFGSNYGAKDLYILQLEDNKLIEMPQNYVEDTTIKDIPLKTLNDEYMCINLSVIDTDDGQLLRIRKLINPHENSAWYVDVYWNGQAWQVENVSVGFAYGE